MDWLQAREREARGREPIPTPFSKHHLLKAIYAARPGTAAGSDGILATMLSAAPIDAVGALYEASRDLHSEGPEDRQQFLDWL